MESQNLNLNLTAILESHKEDLKREAIETLKKSISEQIRWDFSSAVSEATKKFISEEVTPEITALLESNKENILLQISNIADALGEEIKKALVAKAIENMKSSWNVGDIGKKLFG